MPLDDQQNSETISDKIAELLNESSISNKEAVRLNNLKHVQELILHQTPELLDNYLEEVLQFQLDRSSEVKKFVLAFIEEACKIEHEVIFKVIDNFRLLLYDDNVNVQKRAYLAMITIFKGTLKWISRCRSISDESIQQTWLSLCDIKNHISAQLDSDNDGIRTTAIKFIEMLVIVLSNRTKDSVVSSVNDQDFSLDQLSDIGTHGGLLDKAALSNEGTLYFKKLIEYVLSTHISSVNLIASICVMTNIAKQRPKYMQVVLETLSAVVANMPPTLGKSQVNAVKKQIKFQLLSLCRSPCIGEFHAPMTTLLTDVGASSSEINKALPRGSNESRKRTAANDANAGQAALASKKLKSLTEDKSKESGATSSKQAQQQPSSFQQSSLNSIIEDLSQKLSIHVNLVDLVLCSMAFLPDQMPPSFPGSYKPISDAGSTQQVKSLASMFASLLKSAGLVQYDEFNMIESGALGLDDEDNDDELMDSEDVKSSKLAESIKTEMAPPTTPSISMKQAPRIELMAKKSSTKSYKLSEVTANFISTFDKLSCQDLLHQTYDRIVNADDTVQKSKEGNLVRKMCLIELTSIPEYEQHLTNHIFENARKRIDVGLMWIYKKYLNLKRAERRQTMRADEDSESQLNTCMLEYDQNVDNILCNLRRNAVQCSAIDQRDFLFSDIICELPLLTDNCLTLLNSFCQDESHFFLSISTLCDLISTRQSRRPFLLNMLLEFTHNPNVNIRDKAIVKSIKLHERNEYRVIIEKFALDRLKYLVEADKDQPWSEDEIRSCLYLYFDLMTVNHSLIRPLSQIYPASEPDVKRVILRMLEAPIKNMGMASVELLKLIEECPTGSETFISRIIHILTDKTPPSTELVDKVRELYMNRLPDVRFLIPVLTGLSKKEIISALPQLIKLPQPVVKEVFYRLLGTNADSTATTTKSALNSTELLVALHQIDTSVCDLKVVINATSLCFAEKQIYTHEVLAAVMQQLIDITPIPTLYMRTVIQSVTTYPKLTGFVLIILQRLISKQVWKYPKVWEGFVKCCQRIKPVSHQVLVHLPAPQLKEVFASAADLKEHMCKHIQSLAPPQKAQIPEQILHLVENNNGGSNGATPPIPTT